MVYDSLSLPVLLLAVEEALPILQVLCILILRRDGPVVLDGGQDESHPELGVSIESWTRLISYLRLLLATVGKSPDLANMSDGIPYIGALACPMAHSCRC